MCANGRNSKYPFKTLVGSWQENRDRAEFERAIFMDRCMKGELLIQKLALLEDKFLKNVQISGSRDNYLHFNKRVVILCPPPPPERVRVNHSRERPAVVISVDLDESLIYGEMKLKDNVKIVASTMIKPVGRRGGAPSECQITYGAPVQFALAKEDLSDAPLYLASDTVSAIGATNPKSGHRWVFLHSDSDDYNTMWKVEHIDPQYRMESEGLPVPAKSRVILRHCKTNSALAIEHGKMCGFYGVEYEVSSCDHLDGHRVENDTNQMMVCTDLEEWLPGEPHPEATVNPSARPAT